MAQKTTEKKPATPQTKAEEQWRSGRSRFSFQQLRRGSDKRWHFSGQQPNEDVLLIVRKHWWFLVRPALPFLGTVAFLLLTSWAFATAPGSKTLWGILEFIAFLAVIGVG